MDTIKFFPVYSNNFNEEKKKKRSSPLHQLLADAPNAFNDEFKNKIKKMILTEKRSVIIRMKEYTIEK